jgi:gas vesicle protein
MNKVLIAFIAGATLGILFAPDKGSATRKKLADGYDELKNSLQDEFKELYTAEMQRQNRENSLG